MSESGRAGIRAAVAPFETPSLPLALYQIATSIVLYVMTVGLMYWSLSVSYALTLALAVPATFLLTRMFIVQHDCGHGSFFARKSWNDRLGTICGVLTLVPYANWKRQHAQHHANWNNLDRREYGADIYSGCLTVSEYRALSPRRRFYYRLARHPLIAHILVPPFVFLALYRTPFDTPKDWVHERRSVWTTNLAILACWGGLAAIFGITAVLMVQLPIVVLSSITGIWLFSVQHRFENALWMRRGEWNFVDAALKGSSYLNVPRAVHWLTGNIGFHHIHHLSPHVPNYNLAACHHSDAALRIATPLTLGQALRAGRLALWDETRQMLVRFRDVTSSA
jgi:acyl-lipid omega-6 desaturase (Delta-12 desaturase)